MFDFDAGKLLIIGVVALIVIGPKDLPRVLRQVGQMVGKLRRMASEFQGQFMEAMKEADLQDIRDEVAKLQSSTNLDVHFDPARDIQRELTQAVTPTPSVTATHDVAALPEPEAAVVSDTPAAAGFAPAIPEPVVHYPEPPPIAEDHAPKRKIVLKRRPVPTPASDTRTTPSRFRNVKPRRQEALNEAVNEADQ